MTPEIMEERRRSPRYPVTGGEPAILPVSLSVQLLDISQAGVLIQSSQHAKEGSWGRLRFNLAGRPFSTEVEIRLSENPGLGGRLAPTMTASAMPSSL